MNNLKIAISLVVVYLFCCTSHALAAGDPVKDPTGIAPNRYVYYPGTEVIMFECSWKRIG